MPKFLTIGEPEPWETEAWQYNGEREDELNGVCACANFAPHVHTHDGKAVPLVVGDWIIPEPDGDHFSVCKPDVFAANYEPIESVQTPARARPISGAR